MQNCSTMIEVLASSNALVMAKVNLLKDFLPQARVYIYNWIQIVSDKKSPRLRTYKLIRMSDKYYLTLFFFIVTSVLIS